MMMRGAEITLEVDGWPPTKAEAKSLLAAGHPHAERVRALLFAARQAAQEYGWATTSVDIGLDLVVRGPARPASDATNYLGGVGDVLQEKVSRHNLNVSHLADLATVALYVDDRQIREIRYAEEPADRPSYSIRVYEVSVSVPTTAETEPTDQAGAEETASARGRRVVEALSVKGSALGFNVQREYPVPGGRLDVVWLLPTLDALPGVGGLLPIVGFEIESSWRTRKHLKGDYLNLYDLGAAVGVLVLLGNGDDVESTRRFAQTLVDRPGPRVLVWSEQDVANLINGHRARPETSRPASVPSTGSDPTRHVGKFQALWAWLRQQPSRELPTRFSDLEEAIGIPLPASCRKHRAHWSSYDGSAVARAIQDAGWTATRVDVRAEHLVFVRQDPAIR
jgi:hypothetical protein